MPDPLDPQDLTSLIEEYSAFGIHRTGWEGDERTSDWTVAWLRAAGVEAEKSAFEFPLVVTKSAYVEVAGRRFEGTPLYDGGATGATPVFAPLARPDNNVAGRLVIVEEPGSLRRLLEEPTGEARPAGVIAVSGDPDGNIILRNAERIDRPFDLPVLQLAARDATLVLEVARTGVTAGLVVDKEALRATATNVVARLKGTSRDGLVVLMTPKSGWFTCAAERGGGIAITMALARYLAQLPDRRNDLLILFTGGHELGHYGLRSYLRDHAEILDGAELWVHLGASIGAKHPTGSRLFSREDEWRSLAMSAFLRRGAAPVALADKDVRPGGEAREVFDRRFVSLAGGHTYFHSPNDVPAIAADGERVARFGRAFQDILERAVL